MARTVYLRGCLGQSGSAHLPPKQFKGNNAGMLEGCGEDLKHSLGGWQRNKVAPQPILLSTKLFMPSSSGETLRSDVTPKKPNVIWDEKAQVGQDLTTSPACLCCILNGCHLLLLLLVVSS